jgi:hypothetical protein
MGRPKLWARSAGDSGSHSAKDGFNSIDEPAGDILSPSVHHGVEIGRVLDQERGVGGPPKVMASFAACDWRLVHDSLLPAEFVDSSRVSKRCAITSQVMRARF